MCSAPDCERPVKSGGLCSAHYQQRRRGEEFRPPRPRSVGRTLEERMLKYTEKTDGCWNWTGPKNAAGYGRIGSDYERLLAHRAAYELWIGRIPGGFVIDHQCRNKACVNPEHTLRPFR